MALDEPSQPPAPAPEISSPPEALEAASPPPEPSAPGRSRKRPNPAWALLVVLAGWLVPGAAHLLQRRWVRAAGFFLSVAALALTGLVLRGGVFPRHSGNFFGYLGFLSDAASGAFYFGARLIERAGPDVSRAAGDDGTRFLISAGVLNALCLLDALGILYGERK